MVGFFYKAELLYRLDSLLLWFASRFSSYPVFKVYNLNSALETFLFLPSKTGKLLALKWAPLWFTSVRIFLSLLNWTGSCKVAGEGKLVGGSGVFKSCGGRRKV